MRKGLLLFSLLVTLTGFGQKYVSMMQKGTYKFSQIQEEAEKYFANRDKGRGSGYKQWKRWEYVHQQELDKNGYVRSNLELTSKARIFRKKIKVGRGPAKPGVSTTGNWQALGPTYWDRTRGWNPGVGRITSIGVDVNNQQHLIVGGNSGGIWKTTDGGSTWQVLADDLATLYVRSCEISPHNSNVYLWGAEGAVYKSIDGGGTWVQTNMPAGGAVVRMLWHPNNANIIYAACTGSGLYKSTDGGNNWSRVHSNHCLDIEFKSDDPNTIITSGGGVQRSTDGGTTWSDIPGFGTGAKFIGVTPADPSRVYVLEATRLNWSGAFAGFYKSTNGGVSFTKLSHTKNYFGYSPTGGDALGQAPRDQDVCVSPTDADEVHIAGIHSWKSFDGGTNFALSSFWNVGSIGTYGVGYNHADIDILKYHGNTIYCGSDGGIFTSTNKATDWVDKSSGLGIKEFYKIGVSQTDANLVTGGSQDNGTSVMRGANREWKDWLGGDGMETFVDWSNNDVLYGEVQYAQSIYRSDNKGDSYVRLTRPTPIGTQRNWVIPFEQDPQNANTIYLAFRRVHKSTNQGSSWQPISNTESGDIDELKIARSNNQIIWYSYNSKLVKTINGGASWTTVTGTSGTINEISIHPSNPNRVAVSTTSTVYVTTDGGTTWTNYKKNLPNVSLYCLQWSNNANNGLYVGGHGIVMYIDDTMTDWVDFMAGLPNVRVYELEINHSAEKIFAATYGRGLWESDVYGAQIADEEVALTSIDNPTATDFCSLIGQSITPEVTIKNNGANSLTTAIITVKLDNVVQETFNYSGNVVTGGTDNVTLGQINGIGAGSHTLEIEISSPNGQTDFDNSDNIQTHVFTVTQGKSLQLQFTADGSSSENSWEVRDAGNNVVYSYDYQSEGLLDGETMNHDLCLPDGCYNLIVNDDGSDGLTNGSNGNYKIVDLSNMSELTVMGTNSFGSSVTHNFCVSSVVYQYDAAIVAVSGIDPTLCGTSANATVKIKNIGSTTMTSVVIKVYVNGNEVKSINHSTNLAQGATEDVVITGIPYISSGNKSVKFEVLLPNGQSDQNTGDNSKTENSIVTVGDLHEFYIADRSYNNALSWEIKSGSSVIVDNTVSAISKLGNDQVQEFCLAPGCYDFVINDAFIAGGCNSPAWNASTTYVGDASLGAGNGEVVSYNGKEWRAQWWTLGNAPGTNSVWLDLGACNVTYPTDYYGLRKKGSADFFEVEEQNYVSPKTNAFCNGANLTVDFSADKTAVEECETITFTASISGGTASTISWDFGDGAIPASAVGVGPHQVKYSSVGNKTVSLTADATNETKSNYISVTASGTIVPAVTINMTSSPTCENESATFGNSISNEGVNTTFSWKVNGNEVSNTENYTFTNLKNGDKVKLDIVTVDACGNNKNASSNEITMNLTANVTPLISIALGAGSSWPMCQGAAVIVDATAINGGSSGVITWYVNGTLQGTGASFSFADNDGDKITAKLNSSEVCVGTNDVTSNEIDAQVQNCTSADELGIELLKLYPNPASSTLNVEMENISRVRILDVQSKLVDIIDNRGGLTKITLDIKHLVAGTYFVEVTTTNGKQLIKEIQVK